MIKYFTDGFTLKRYVEDSSAWSDGEGDWVVVSELVGHLRTLSGNELARLPELETTHRFYTKDSGIDFGDKIVHDGKEYKVKLVDHKTIKSSALSFFQVDLEGLA